MAIRSITILFPILVLSAASYGGSATWNLSPTSGDWNTAANWTPATVPNGPSDTATFGLSNTTGVAVSASTEVNEIVFGSGASAFTLSVNSHAVLTIDTGGVVNSSGATQNFIIASGAELSSPVRVSRRTWSPTS